MERQVAQEWALRWDAQQERYSADREERFAVIVDVVEHRTAGAGTALVVDLGCGPGSCLARLHARLPGAQLVGVDNDPVLLEIARASCPAGTVTLLDADLTDLTWVESVRAIGHPVDAIVSTTALHWVPPADLAALYRAMGGLVRPGGVLVNADHLYDDQPSIAELAGAVRSAHEHRAGVVDNEDWASWWRAAAGDPDLGDLVAARRARGIAGGYGNRLTVADHAAMARAGGFDQVGRVWQKGDDVVLVAVR